MESNTFETLATALGIGVPMPTDNTTAITTNTYVYDANVPCTLTNVANVPLINTIPVAVSNAPIDHLNRDTQLARENMHEVIIKAGLAADQLTTIAAESQTPRAYEVVEKLLRLQADTSKELLLAHKVRKDIEPTSPQPSAVTPNGGTYIANAVFMGTNAELLDLINGKSHRVIEHEDMKED